MQVAKYVFMPMPDFFAYHSLCENRLIACLFFRGSGDSYHLGHGNTDHVRKPCAIEALAQHCVKDIAAGSHHCLALTDDGELFGWGANTIHELGAEARESIPIPTLLSEASKSGVVYIACGSHEVCGVFVSDLAMKICKN